MRTRGIRVREMALIALFVALLAASAFFRIPLPPIPVTLQVQVALVGGILLGRRNGALATVVYLGLGLVGLPIFSGGGGFSYVLQPTFGFLLGFVGGAYLCGMLSDGTQTVCRIFCAQLAGLTVVYLLGIVWYFTIVLLVNPSLTETHTLLVGSLLVSMPTDAVLAFVTSAVVKRLHPQVMRIIR
ncbi:MAG: biotin transporter BioY [Clostridia bacterium]|nr:biotin transporter BioY [Clostridia bacterium]